MKAFPAFQKSAGSKLYSQKLDTGSYPEPHQSSLLHHIPFLKDYLYCYRPIYGVGPSRGLCSVRERDAV